MWCVRCSDCSRCYDRSRRTTESENKRVMSREWLKQRNTMGSMQLCEHWKEVSKWPISCCVPQNMVEWRNPAYYWGLDSESWWIEPSLDFVCRLILHETQFRLMSNRSDECDSGLNFFSLAGFVRFSLSLSLCIPSFHFYSHVNLFIISWMSCRLFCKKCAAV